MRLDGWKSIATYFNRERTTVIRWSVERGMPVHRIPGTSRGSVYALSEELDRWLATSREGGLDETGGERISLARPDAPGPRTGARRRRWIIASLSLLVGAALSVAVYAWTGPDGAPNVQMPRDSGAAAIFVEARADWARRTPQSILAAIDKLQRVVGIEPDFAPGYSALADSFLLAREFGSLPDVEAFSRAQIAVDTALKIDPEQASALRAKGFIDYWWRGDRAAAGRSFRRALAIDPKAAQTQFWFANALIDNGEFEHGMRRFAEARLLEPASPAIAADLAWARWSVGETRQAKIALLGLQADSPSLATIPDYLSVIALADDDVRAFVAQLERKAELRSEPGLRAYVAELRTAMADGPRAVANKIIAAGLIEVDRGERRTLVWPAFVASSTQDRAALLRVLRKAEARGEVWGSAGLARHMIARWRHDTEIASLLQRRRPTTLLSETQGMSDEA